MSEDFIKQRANPKPRHAGRLTFSRRTWLKTAAAASAVTLLELKRPHFLLADFDDDSPIALDMWVTLTAEDEIKIFFAKSEMGQGVWTTLAMILVEEIGLDPKKTKVRQAPSTPEYTNPAAGLSMTAGSTSVRTQYPLLREAGAKARLRILRAASRTLGRDVDELDLEEGLLVERQSGQTHPLSRFRKAIAAEPLPDSAPMKDPSRYRHLGTNFGELDSSSKARGTLVFGADIRLDELVYASIIHNPAYGSLLLNGSELRSQVDEHAFVELDDGFAVAGPSFWSADREARRLASLAQYEDGAAATGFDNTLLHEELIEALGSLDNTDESSPSEARRKGEPERAFDNADAKIEALYTVPFLPHLCMETPTATARVELSAENPDMLSSVEVWAPTQSALFVQRTLSSRFGLSADRITVHVTRLGGGFGRKAMTDYVVQAVTIAKALKRPVQLIWNREQDIQHDHFRPAFAARMRASLSRDSRAISWLADSSGPSISRSTGRPPQGLDPASLDGFLEEHYQFENERIRHKEIITPVPLGFWRSVGASQNTFFMECFVDEIATLAQEDPLAFRMSRLRDERMKRVLSELDNLTDWSSRGGKPLDGTRAWGIALYKGFGSYVGQIAEVSLGRGRTIRVHRVWCAVDCGLALNPRGIEAQVQGSIVYGLTAALGLEVSFENGRCLQTNFNDTYALPPREMPEVILRILESTESVGGMGEPATPPIAPAVANALFRLTGDRLRSLPLKIPN